MRNKRSTDGTEKKSIVLQGKGEGEMIGKRERHKSKEVGRGQTGRTDKRTV